MTEAKRPIRVFLCHASQDKPAVRGLYKRLNGEGWIDPWLDEEKLLPGQDWEVEIRKAVREADAIVVFISNHSKTKEGFVQKEIRFALDIADEKPEGTIYIIPARLEECDLPDRLKRWHWVNLYDTKGFNRLLASLQRRADALDLEVTPERKSWLERFFKYLGERKEIIFSTLGILVALLALLFGDNIYEQITGRSIFATKPVPSVPSNAAITLTPKPITPSQPHETTQSSETFTLTVIPFKGSTPTPTSLPTEITDAKGVQMVFVPSGKFTMGSNNGLVDERPVHEVYLDAHYIDKYEVTNALYEVCVDNGGCTPPKNKSSYTRDSYYGTSQYDDYPVINVDWSQAATYCEWRGGSLPTEAQWEKAARSTDQRTYPWGEGISCNEANYYDKRPLKVFLCHAHADRDAVKALYARLTKDGVDAWLDKEKLLPGQDWELEIRKAVREADVVVVCLSKQFNQAGFRQKEVRLALDTAMEQPEGEIFIIPARLEECDTLESLRKWHWVDLFEDDGYERLVRALQARANKIGVGGQICMHMVLSD
jgi:hypothetical protein